MPTEYPAAFKRQVIRRYEKGEPIKKLSQELHISQSTIYQWRKQYCTIQTEARTYTPKEFDAISRRLIKLEHEMEIIKATGYLDEIPLQRKLKTLEEMYRTEGCTYSVHELCEALDVARGTFYNHIFRRADPTGREKKHEELMLKVQQVFDDNQQRLGADKIRTILVKAGLQISTKQVATIMRELNLRSIRIDAKKQYKKLHQHQKKNLLEQDFTADYPNQIWVSDITYFKVNDYGIYLCIIMDLFSRMIVGYRVSRNASTNLVATAFRNAYHGRGKPSNLTFHSDRGTQYTSRTFTKLLQANGVKQSFSATGQPHDNAVAESFFATFKQEEAYRREYTSEQSFRKSAEKYISFYNEVRPHKTLKYQTPQAFEDNYNSKFVKNTCSNNDMA